VQQQAVFLLFFLNIVPYVEELETVRRKLKRRDTYWKTIISWRVHIQLYLLLGIYFYFITLNTCFVIIQYANKRQTTVYGSNSIFSIM